MKRNANSKPAGYPPYEGYPLTLRADGRLCKKIRGAVRYFGRWPDWQPALDEYVKQRDELHAGRAQQPVGGYTLGEAIQHFLDFKRGRVSGGKLGQRSWKDYKRTCDLLTTDVPAQTPLASLEAADFQRMAGAIEKGTPRRLAKDPKRRVPRKKRGPLNPTTQKGHLNRATILFSYIVQNGLTDKPLRYQQALAPPDQLQFARLKLARGVRDFTLDEIQAMVKAADPVLGGMILLGLSCAFSNADCGTLTFAELDLKAGWHHKPRFKTGTERHAPLWPEVATAIKAAIAVRPESDSPLVFLRPDGGAWVDQDECFNYISEAFRKLLVQLGFYKKGVTGFYGLRRTFATIAANAGNQPAVNHVMGHKDSTMPGLYRQHVYAERLIEVSQFVRRWYLGEEKLQRSDRDGFAPVEWS